MSEIIGIGCDLCTIARMERLLEKQSFMDRCFTREEQEYLAGRGGMAASSAAALWAAKEAALKAFGVGLSIPMTDVEVRHLDSGRPVYALKGEALALSRDGRLHLSLSHEGGMAMAFCVWETQSGA